MTTGSKFCSVCMSGYRLASIHATSDKHRRKLRGPTPPHRSTLSHLFHDGGRPSAYSRARQGEGAGHVRKYRRRHPLDGSPRDVQVDAYWRQARSAYRPGGISFTGLLRKAKR